MASTCGKRPWQLARTDDGFNVHRERREGFRLFNQKRTVPEALPAILRLCDLHKLTNVCHGFHRHLLETIVHAASKDILDVFPRKN